MKCFSVLHVILPFLVVTFKKFRRQNPFAPFSLQKLQHYYGFFHTCNVHPYFHTRTFVSSCFSVSITSQDSPVPFMSLCHAPVTSTPTAIHTVNRYLMDFYPGGHTISRFRLYLSALTMLRQFFTFVQLHDTQLTTFVLPFPHTLSTIAFDYSTYECFAICACTPIAEGPLPSHKKHCFSYTIFL